MKRTVVIVCEKFNATSKFVVESSLTEKEVLNIIEEFSPRFKIRFDTILLNEAPVGLEEAIKRVREASFSHIDESGYTMKFKWERVDDGPIDPDKFNTGVYKVEFGRLYKKVSYAVKQSILYIIKNSNDYDYLTIIPIK